ncbi:polysaccharide deacetylase family protein [Patescibacteria group bacterium]|nr:polysaccharide deacetylase family protein [Patescibacteria group bacterium]
MKILLLACDFEEFSLPFDFGAAISEELMLETAFAGIQRLLKVVRDHSIKITFFVTEKISETYPDLLRQLIADGHEVGLHANIDYKKNGNAQETIAEIKYIKEKIEKNIRTKIYGFKNHKLVVLPFDIVRKSGFDYDNSCHPTYVPGRYCNFLKSRRMKSKSGLVNIPISVTPIIRLPFSWIWFRWFGLNYAKFCTSWALFTHDYINIYFHSWDFANIDRKMPFKLPYVITRNTGNKTLGLLDNFLAWCKRKDLRAETIHNYLSRKV